MDSMRRIQVRFCALKTFFTSSFLQEFFSQMDLNIDHLTKNFLDFGENLNSLGNLPYLKCD